MAQAWFLVICAVLCLMLGADALKCSNCVVLNQEETCQDTCEASGEDSGCMAKKVFFGGKLRQKFLMCYDLRTFHRCQSPEHPEKKTRLEYKCCTDEDFCNSKL